MGHSLIEIVNNVYSSISKQLEQQFSEAAIANHFVQLLSTDGQAFVVNRINY